MPDFNRMTIVAATEVLSDYKSHNDIELLQVEWGIAGRCNASKQRFSIWPTEAFCVRY